MARAGRGSGTLHEVHHWQNGLVGGVQTKGAKLALIISGLDLDAHTAAQIIALKPHTVLNSEPSYSGRFPARGPVQLVQAGIELIDDLGADILTVSSETLAEITEGTVTVSDEVLCEGERRSLEELLADQQEAQGGVGDRVTALVGAAAVRLRAGSSAVSIETGNQLLLYVPLGGQRHKDLRHYLARQQPTVLAVDEGWAEALAQSLRPTYVVLSPGQSVPELPRRYRPKQIFVLAVPGQSERQRSLVARLEELGWDYVEAVTDQTSIHYALDLARASEARLVVWAGPQVTDPSADLLERTPQEGADELLLRVALAGRLVDASAVKLTSRPPIASVWLLLFIFVGLSAIAMALAVTVFGVDLANVLGWFDWTSKG